LIRSNKGSREHIDEFDIDICTSRLGILSNINEIYEEVIEFPALKSILHRSAKVHPNMEKYLQMLEGMWLTIFIE
jgi:hypothetical protein